MAMGWVTLAAEARRELAYMLTPNVAQRQTP
jgi:hypothetical protein